MSRRKTKTHHRKCTISNGLDISRVVSYVSRQPYIGEKQQIGPLPSWFRYIHHFILLSFSSLSSSISPSQTIYARTTTLGQNAVKTEKQKNSNQMMKVVSLPRWYRITFSFVHFRSPAMNRWKRRDAINLEEYGRRQRTESTISTIFFPNICWGIHIFQWIIALLSPSR